MANSSWRPMFHKEEVWVSISYNNNKKLACEYDQMPLTIISFTILNSLKFSNQMLVFGERGKPEYPEKNPLQQSREPTN